MHHDKKQYVSCACEAVTLSFIGRAKSIAKHRQKQRNCRVASAASKMALRVAMFTVFDGNWCKPHLLVSADAPVPASLANSLAARSPSHLKLQCSRLTEGCAGHGKWHGGWGGVAPMGLGSG